MHSWGRRSTISAVRNLLRRVLSKAIEEQQRARREQILLQAVSGSDSGIPVLMGEQALLQPAKATYSILISVLSYLLLAEYKVWVIRDLLLSAREKPPQDLSRG